MRFLDRDKGADTAPTLDYDIQSVQSYCNLTFVHNHQAAA
jgi:hypothetical protein